MKNANTIPSSQLMDKNKQINLTFLKQALYKQNLISIQLFEEIIEQFCDLVGYQPNLLKLQEPIRVIGDIHGQYGDLLKILSLCPSLENNPKQKILFLGDYVDRGINGTEVCILLFALKIRFPKQVFMLRGNHQTRQMTQMNNFFNEFVSKYTQDLYFQIMDVFDLLPLACVINNQYFCVHGGISPETVVWDNVQKINELDRFQQVPFQGEICDFVWSDPIKDQNGNCSDVCQQNDSRGCSIYFGRQLSQHFLKKNNLKTIIRAHQIIDKEGYKKHIWPNWNNQPTVVTIFSAPNYCGTYQNKAVILSIQNSKMQLRQFKQENPSCPVPEQYDGITLSVPKLLTIFDKFVRKMVNSYTNTLIPQGKKYTEDQKIKLILQYVKIKNAKHKAFQKNVQTTKIPLKNDNNANKQTSKIQKKVEQNKKIQTKVGSSINKNDQYYFRRSVEYFSQIQKRPSSKIFMKKPNDTKKTNQKGDKSKSKQKQKQKQKDKQKQQKRGDMRKSKQKRIFGGSKSMIH